MDVEIASSPSSTLFPGLADNQLDLSGIPFAAVSASGLNGDLALFNIPERRWDMWVLSQTDKERFTDLLTFTIPPSPVDGVAPDTPESFSGTPVGIMGPETSRTPPLPDYAPAGVTLNFMNRGRNRKRQRSEQGEEYYLDGNGPSPAASSSSSHLAPGTDQVAIPASAQASSLSQLGLSNIYSTSGFDTLGILSRLYTRPSPRVELGPIDTSSSFIVVDAHKEDYPIVYVSENFKKLTGYGLNEVLGRNCRFLQAPDGIVRKGSVRKYVDNNVIMQIKMSVDSFQEAQFTQINYKKGGSPFVNMITIVPLTWDSDEVRYFVGFQVDLEDQSQRILKRMFDGTYFFPVSKTRGRAIEPSSITELGPDGEQQQSDESGKKKRRQGSIGASKSSRMAVASITEVSEVTPSPEPSAVFAKPFAPFKAKAPVLTPDSNAPTYPSPPTLSLAEIQQVADPLLMQVNQRPGIFKPEMESPAYAASSTFAASPAFEAMSPLMHAPSQEIVPSPALTVMSTMPTMDDIVDVRQESDEDTGEFEDEEEEEDSEEEDEDADFFQPKRPAKTATKVAKPAPKAQPAAQARKKQSGELEDVASAMLHPRRLAENQMDFTFILSSRGIFLYATARGCLHTVGYDTSELVGRTLSDFIHPHDLPSVARDLRACKPGHAMTAVFRFKRKNPADGGEYVWVETTGHKYELDNRKRTKCFVLSAREKVVDMIVPSVLVRDTPVLDHITLSDSQGQALKWCKLTLEGLVLYASHGLTKVVDGTTLYARKLWDALDAKGGAAALEAFAHMKQNAKAGSSSGPNRFNCSFKTGKIWLPAVVELHFVGTYPNSAVFAAIEMITDDTQAFADSLEQMPAQQTEDAAVDWSLLEVRQQSSLQHKQNWLRVQNKKLFDSISDLVTVV